MIELVKRLLKEANVLYILYGEDDFSRRQALIDIKAGLSAGDLLQANTNILEGKQLTIDQLAATCNTVPFLAPQRLVIVEGLLKRFESRTSSEQFPEVSSFSDCIKNIPTTTILVLLDESLKPQNSLLKVLSPLASVKMFPVLKGDNLKLWCQKRVKQTGGHISEGAASLLTALVGEDLWAITSEIDKLLLYSEGRPITEVDVQAVVSQASQASIFRLVDAILEGRSTEAIKLLHRLFDDGLHPAYILVMITRQFRLALQARELYSEGLKLPEIKQQLGQTFVTEKALAQGRQYSQQQLEKAYRQLLDVDLSIKRGKIDSELALDLLVAELSKAKQGGV
jgi:DNA polymerase-3 subunit delta